MIQNTHIVQYNIHIQYPYIVGKYKINLNELKKQVEKGAFDEFFYRSTLQLFSDNLAVVFDLLILQDTHNIRTLSINIKLICTRCETE
jgi:hypothetical protein